ncbi:hypothetical protein V5N11_016203 [Cardamine amara subsp. amara]|uniref:Reverse transcriptase zinc-binding domain-containing protein n=1 Tax=Cardamine amara subsp. amara TaxID=228776 RepID=A0ABD1BVA6_CARAN
MCQRCSSDSESINHILFDCPLSRSVWRQSNTIFSGSQAQDNSLEENIEILLSRYDQSTSKELQHLPFRICWQIWKSRNALIFNKEKLSTDEVIDKAKDSVNEWLTAISQDTRVQPSGQLCVEQRESKWIPPPSDFFKINVDGSFHLNNQYIGVGWIIRDDHGVYRLAGCSRLIQAY